MAKSYEKLVGFMGRNGGKSLEQLDGEDWGDPDAAPTNLVRRCLLARRKPIRDMPIDDLRCLIGQGIGLKYLMPRALDLIEADPLDETGVGYPGALFCAVLRTKPDFWRDWPDMAVRVSAVLDGLKRVPDFVGAAAGQFRSNTSGNR